MVKICNEGWIADLIRKWNNILFWFVAVCCAIVIIISLVLLVLYGETTGLPYILGAVFVFIVQRLIYHVLNGFALMVYNTRNKIDD